jgi:outer membrane protein assembly factor BamA
MAVDILQLRPGHIYNNGAGKQALKNIDSLGLFSTIEVQPRPDETNQGGVIVAIKLKEHDPKSAQVITDWSIVPGSQGRPTLVMCNLLFFQIEYVLNMLDTIVNIYIPSSLQVILYNLTTHVTTSS